MFSNKKYKRIDKPPFVSIITVVLNGEKYFEETIQSVINQNYPNIEYIIIDGGSTDSTLDIIKKYEKNIDYWVSEPDHGLYDAINKGISVAKGEIIASLHSDDLYFYNNVVKRVVDEFMKDNELYWVYGDFCSIDENSKIKNIYRIPNYNWKMLLFSNYCYIPHPTTFFRKEVFNQVGHLDDRYKLSADYDFFLRLGDRYKAKRLKYPITKFRFHKKRLSESKEKQAIEERKQIQEKYRFFKKKGHRLFYSLLILFKFKLLNLKVYFSRMKDILCV
ncbi:hypothetical protein A2230_08200 [candidate division WOR-1 bacterium RIFOXYA2_FULL_36_21]|uniref:Glycosyltransferase 2-like domain-containing protein n=1 Tax=candidate division WOR-1 bacterium RIFOXYB2_FULL_36_35 TaxID=1802578 RepID=A0A1F4S8C2_UNCSA|nr:MAG: hypothetical protein A2230_08200 [candidate division WOR-1 bacterium RIFOXYA2_FULL_36_21]OGC14622.1 MAG: hypothetical protein A2282_04215 [candidate division WOR-1 bacterium RIFOXYA12_FULL_36_13]OGC16637.1 MAG: hypothetical protein A2290_03415 [candidate division WOR-1 bacterium RIFOXYB2_FULL_36_35]